MKVNGLRLKNLGMLRAAIIMTAVSLLARPAAHAQALGWEGETGVFVTPLA
jgi:hypothetical protein